MLTIIKKIKEGTTNIISGRAVLSIVVSSVLVLASILLMALGFCTHKTVSVNYQEGSSKVDYRVYLNNNSFFDSEYLNSGQTYIASLIKYVDATYYYNVDFSEPVSGNLNYQLVATVSAEREGADNSSYWSRSYNLSDVETYKVDNIQNIGISKNIKIDYGKYNDILHQFKSAYSLSATGKLSVALVVTGDLSSANLTDGIDYQTSLEYNIPLAEQAVEASVSVPKGADASKTIKRQVVTDSTLKLIMRLVGCLLEIISAYFLVVSIIYGRRHAKTGLEYENTVKKLLSAYDSIIVDIKTEPDTRGMNVSVVDRFDELVDVYNAVRMPINFYRTRTTSNFIIINENMAWEYIVDAKDFNPGERKTKGREKA